MLRLCTRLALLRRPLWFRHSQTGCSGRCALCTRCRQLPVLQAGVDASLRACLCLLLPLLRLPKQLCIHGLQRVIPCPIHLGDDLITPLLQILNLLLLLSPLLLLARLLLQLCRLLLRPATQAPRLKLQNHPGRGRRGRARSRPCAGGRLGGVAARRRQLDFQPQGQARSGSGSCWRWRCCCRHRPPPCCRRSSCDCCCRYPHRQAPTRCHQLLPPLLYPILDFLPLILEHGRQPCWHLPTETCGLPTNLLLFLLLLQLPPPPHRAHCRAGCHALRRPPPRAGPGPLLLLLPPTALPLQLIPQLQLILCRAEGSNSRRAAACQAVTSTWSGMQLSTGCTGQS